MSFASDRTAHAVPTVTRGRIVIGGGFKNGGFSMYGSSPQTRSLNSNAPAWYEDIQDELREKHDASLREAQSIIQRQEKLDLRRAIRKKSGKLEDTEGMMYEQALIDKELREKKYLEELELKNHKQGVNGVLRAMSLFLFVGLLLTPFWWVGLVLFLYLTLRHS